MDEVRTILTIWGLVGRICGAAAPLRGVRRRQGVADDVRAREEHGGGRVWRNMVNRVQGVLSLGGSAGVVDRTCKSKQELGTGLSARAHSIRPC